MESTPVAAVLIFDFYLLLIVLAGSRMKGNRLQSALVAALFLCSGVPALVYQIVWQRALFVIYGVNVQSVAVVVSAFMLGLGMGSLIGGRLSERFPRQGILIFGICELGIAGFGMISLRLFHWAASYTAGASLGYTILFSFLLLIVPTMLMGATLPLLVEKLVHSSLSVGYSVATLYFVNTLGSALACYLCALFLMHRCGQFGSVISAACLNTAVGGTAILYGWFQRHEEERAAPNSPSAVPGGNFDLRAASLIAGVVGFLSLGFEIAWFRVFSIATLDRAPAFALLLATYLAGIAAGSFISDDLTARKHRKPLVVAGTELLIAGAISVYLAPLMAWLAEIGRPVNFAVPAFFVTAALIGSVLPLLCQSAVQVGNSTGRGVSLIYVSNIVGSTCGSLVIGFVLMNYFGGEAIALQLATATVVTGLVLLFLSYDKLGAVPTSMLVVSVLCAGAIPVAHFGYKNLYGKLVFGTHSSDTEFAVKYTKENRNGVVVVSANNAVFSGGVHDGYFNIRPENEENMIIRAYALGLLHPHPRRVLVIGLASGSWAQVIANNPEVETMDIVEINPGYLPIIDKYPDIRSLLRNPKVHIFIDDGRRWLLAHPDARYDAVVANSTFHWRDHSSQLLSFEFLQLVKLHLLPGGVHYYNATGSRQVYATGLRVFKYGVRVINFIAVSDSPFTLDKDAWVKQLGTYEIDGRRMFNGDTGADQKALIAFESFAQTLKEAPKDWGLERSEDLSARIGSPRLITDDNMGEEWSRTTR